MTTATAPDRPTVASAARPPLAGVCEPLFLYVCRVNRQSRLGTKPAAAAAVRSDVVKVLATVEAAATKAGWSADYAKLKHPLARFADDAIAAVVPGSHPVADPGGGDLPRAVSAAVEATDPSAVDRLEVLYTALALAGDARYADDPAHLEAVLNRCAARIWGRMDADESAKLCPDTYAATRRYPLPKPAANRSAALVAVVVLVVGAALAVGGGLSAAGFGGLKHDLETYLHGRGK